MRKAIALFFGLFLAVTVFAGNIVGEFTNGQNSASIKVEDIYVTGTLVLNGADYIMKGKLDKGVAYVEVLDENHQLIAQGKISNHNSDVVFEFTEVTVGANIPGQLQLKPAE